MSSTTNYWDQINRLGEALQNAEAVIIGAGAGLSTSAGLTYAGERFERYFADFIDRYHFTDMYTAGFHSFTTLEEQWAYWSRHIYYNRYVTAPGAAYAALRKLVENRNYFVLTTNVDHQFQLAGFARERLFYTQGDYGLWQCSIPCHQKNYDNEAVVKKMLAEQKDLRVPAELVPYCPVCGKPMAMNLRADHTFVEDDGWHEASRRYADFLNAHAGGRILLLELGVGSNTPAIIKFPFWRLAKANENAIFATINLGEAFYPKELEGRSICLDADISRVLDDLMEAENKGNILN